MLNTLRLVVDVLCFDYLRALDLKVYHPRSERWESVVVKKIRKRRCRIKGRLVIQCRGAGTMA